MWATLPHPEYAKLTIHDVLEHEQTHLMPMVSPFDGYVEVLARVSSTCLISVQRNRYSVPCQLAHQMVSAHFYPDRIEVYAENARIARHVRLMDRDQIRYDWQHYIPLIERKPGALRNGAPFADMPQPLATLQSALLRREHGDRVMAKVLAAVRAQGLEAVLVAVELVLESGVPRLVGGTGTGKHIWLPHSGWRASSSTANVCASTRRWNWSIRWSWRRPQVNRANSPSA